MRKRLTIIAIFAIVMAGCVNQVGPREGTGSLLGAGAGALIGSQIGSGGGQIAAIALGTLAGALIGQDIGRTLDRTDRAYMQQSTQRSLEVIPTNQTNGWVNPDTGHSGSLTPLKTYQNASGEYCREYQQTVVINGDEQQAYGHACRQVDGSWKITSTAPEAKVQTVTRYVQVDRYRMGYPSAYYPGYYSSDNFWPSTSLNFSFGHYSGYGHYSDYGHYWGHGHH